MIKKLSILILMIGVSMAFVSCDFLKNTTLSSTSESESTSDVITRNTTIQSSDTLTTTDLISTTTETVTTVMTTTETVTTEVTTVLTTEEPTTTTTSLSYGDPFIPTGYNLLQDELDYVGIPSMGNPKVLVFAVDFSDYPSTWSDVTISDIETAFNGDSNDLDYESLNSYYYQSSYGNLDLTADVYGYYRASQPASYYEDEYDRLWATDAWGNYLYDDVTYPDSDLIYEVLSYYDDDIDYADYDYNNDGYIDGIYIVYSYPVSYYSGSDLWWAYQDYYAYTDHDYFDGVSPCYFVWAGSDFFNEGSDDINARTIIHETGHMLGLDDYYDYDDSDNYNSGGLGGADMMDYAYGDHNPFSKMLLGWVTPWVVEESMALELLPFVDSGQVILLIDEWRGTIFDEYILLDFYTPTGLNYADRFDLFTLTGIEIYHVSAAIDNGYNEDYVYYSIFNNNNTDSPDKLISIVEADMNDHIEDYSLAENGDLFQVGDVFGGNIYSSYRWDNNSVIGFDVAIVSIDQEKAVVQIFF